MVAKDWKGRRCFEREEFLGAKSPPEKEQQSKIREVERSSPKPAVNEFFLEGNRRRSRRSFD